MPLHLTELTLVVVFPTPADDDTPSDNPGDATRRALEPKVLAALASNNWDGVREFPASMAYKVQNLRACNATLFMRPSLLQSLPTDELATYVRKCFGGGKAMMYPETSLYSVRRAAAV